MKEKIKFIIFILCSILIFGTASNTKAQDTQYPKSFKISPDIASQTSFMMRPFYNPNLKKYVVFYSDPEYKSTAWSRLVSPKGKTAGGVNKIYKGKMFWGDVAYNADEDKFFFVLSDENLDGVMGKLQDSKGRDALSGMQGDSTTEITVKKGTGYYSAPMPKVVWIPATNEYGVAWYDFHSGGWYYTAFDSNLKRTVPIKKVMSGPAGNFEDHWEITVSALIPLPDKLFLGTAKWIGSTKHRPMGFFIDFKGDMEPGPDRDTGKKIIYPGKKVKGSGEVRAAYNPTSGRLLLTWTDGDKLHFEKRGSEKSYFRIIDSKGRFKTKAKQVSETNYRYQGNIEVVYNSTDNKFLLVWPEYFSSLYYSSSPDEIGLQSEGRLLAHFVDDNGNFLDKNPTTLVPTIKDKTTALIFAFHGANLAYNPDGNQYLITYSLYTLALSKSILWGLIYQ